MTTQTEKRRERAFLWMLRLQNNSADERIEALLSFATEIEREAIERCEKVCRELCLSGTHEFKRDAACVECADAIAKLKE